MLSWRRLYTNPPSPTKPTATITPSPIPAFFPALIPPPPPDAVTAPSSALMSLWLTSLAGSGTRASEGESGEGDGEGESDEGGEGGDAEAGEVAGELEGDGGREI